jgi:NitT/TauT family transport system permease protein
MRHNTAAWLQPLVFFGAIFLIWEYGVVYFEVKPYLLPRLSAVLAAVWQSRALMWQHSLVTMLEVAAGFGAAVVGGLVLGILIYVSRTARNTVYPLVTALQSMPKVAIAPLMIVWFGYGLFSKVAMSFLFAFFPIVIATMGGFLATPAALEEHFRALRASQWQTFARLRLPSALPVFLDGCKVAMPLAVIGAVIGEFVGSQEGLGNLILMATASARTDLVFATVLVITVLSMMLYGLIELIDRGVWWRGIHV